TSLDTARSACIDEGALAKSVVLEDERGFVLAVLPASRRLELGRVRNELGRSLHLSQENDMVRLFPDCALGAVPALGAAYGLQTVVDASLEGREEVFFEGGDHETLVRMDGGDFLDLLDGASVADIASEHESLSAALVLRERLYDSLMAVGRAIAAPLGSGSRWRERLYREMTRLRDALDEHIEETEGPEGLLAEIVFQAPRLWREVDHLRDEHSDLKDECDRVIALLGRQGPSLSLRSQVHILVSRFEEHRHRGADLVYEAFDVDIGGG
ncbi:MAG TPA: YbaK/EbsC family protein, partial [Myxococcota bacterium]